MLNNLRLALERFLKTEVFIKQVEINLMARTGEGTVIVNGEERAVKFLSSWSDHLAFVYEGQWHNAFFKGLRCIGSTPVQPQ